MHHHKANPLITYDLILPKSSLAEIDSDPVAEEYVEGMQVITRASNCQDQIICTGKATELKDFIHSIQILRKKNWTYKRWNGGQL